MSRKKENLSGCIIWENFIFNEKEKLCFIRHFTGHLSTYLRPKGTLVIHTSGYLLLSTHIHLTLILKDIFLCCRVLQNISL